MASNKKYLIIIAGPTASGKTGIAIQLAQYFKTEIISCDSRQIYKEMSIGTAKPSKEELSAAQHHFINHCSIKDDYDAGKYEIEVDALLKELFSKHDVVVMAGGTGLFIQAATRGLDVLPQKSDQLRSKWNSIYETKGLLPLQEEIQKLDPKKWEEMDQQNPQRLIRAIEICSISGKTHQELQGLKSKIADYKRIEIGLNVPRDLLYQKINTRVDQMLEEGLLDEVVSLKPHQNLNSLKTVGYTEIFEYLNGNCTLDFAIDKIKQHSRNYAKRQVTWFKKMGVKWMDPNDFSSILNYVSNEIKQQN